MNTISTIACPACGNPISFDIYGLLAGNSFCCPKCSASFGLSTESYGVVSSTMQKFEELKQSAGR